MARSLKNNFDSIIFDLDGTLWDSTHNVALAWQAAINEVPYINEPMTQEKVRSITGMTYDSIFDKLFPTLNELERAEVQSLCGKHELEILHTKGGELYPGLDETLNYLSKKYKLFIVSNCQSGYIEVFFNISRMEHHFIGHQCFGTK